QGFGRRVFMDQGGRPDMHRVHFVEGHGATTIGPVARGRPPVIEGVLRFAVDRAYEGERGLVGATPGVSKLDPRSPGVIGNHAAEQIGRNATDERRRGTESPDADGNVET